MGKGHRLLAVGIAAFFLIAVAAAQVRAAPDPGIIDFVADSETGDFTQWGCSTATDSSGCDIYDATLGTGGRGVATGEQRVRIDSTRTRQGLYSTRFELHQGDGAYILRFGDPGNDFSFINWFRDDEAEPLGKTYWWGFSVQFGKSWPEDFATFGDWHQKRVHQCSGPAPINLDAGRRFRLVVRGGTCSRWLQTAFAFDERGYRGMTQRWNGGNDPPKSGLLLRGRWYDFVLGVRWAADRTGWIELWMAPRGKRLKNVVPRKHLPTTFSDGEGVYLKTGIYRSRTVATPGLMWQDAWRRGTTFARVAATRGCCAR